MDRPRDPTYPADRDLDINLNHIPDRPSDVPIQADEPKTSDMFEDIDELDARIGIQGKVSPDTGLYGSGDGIFVGELEDQAAVEGTTSDPSEPNAVDAVTYEGKTVFSPHELNQSGEDKEYFHPAKGHRFDAPKDANDHALTPDIEVTPDNDIKPIR